MADQESLWDPYREFFERSADAFLIIEGDRFVECNEETVRILRAENREQVLQTHPSELSPATQPDGRGSREKADEMMALAMRNGNHRFEWVHRRVDGTDFPVEVLLTMVPRADGARLHVVWRDISDRRRLEEELRHTQKMEALGKLAGGIAHDFNNLLVAILGHAELLSMESQGDPKLTEHAKQIRDAGERAADLVRQLLIFGRKDQPRTSVFDLAELVRESERLLRRLIGEDVELALDAGPAPLPVRADTALIQQVVLNLASNARDAMPQGGRFALQLRALELKEGDVEGMPAGRYAELAALDTGEGMDAGTLRRAFDPFFTTKEVGKGTGLGLATAHGVVERVGGRIVAESTPQVGSRFRVLLPLSDAVASRQEAPQGAPQDAPVGGDETLLLVEDDFAVSTLLVDMLETVGYRVLHARDGREALALYWERHDEVDLLISDVIMPSISGPELLRSLARAGHTPRALLISGYTGDAIERSGGSPQGVELLRKPFPPATFLRRVRAALDAPRQTADADDVGERGTEDVHD